jgi:hypothetical protein
MRARLFLRSAAVLTLLLGIGHMMGRPWTPKNDLLAGAVTEAMKSHRMHVMGFDRTFMDFYQGFGVTLGVNLLAEGVVLWMLGGLVITEPARTRQIATVLFVMSLLNTAICGIYLFTAPLVLSGAVTLCLAAAVFAPSRALRIVNSTNEQ